MDGEVIRPRRAGAVRVRAAFSRHITRGSNASTYLYVSTMAMTHERFKVMGALYPSAMVTHYRRTTDQTNGFADCGRRDVTACMDWMDEYDADHERFVSLNYGAWETKKLTRFISTEYELTQRKSFNSQAECMAAWEEKKFPRHNVEYDSTHGIVAHSYSSENFHAYAHTDGTGHVDHYDTLAAVRTRNDTVFNNSQDYGNGFARVTHASSAEARVPLTTIRDSGVLPEGFDVYDLHDYTRASRLDVSGVNGKIYDRTDRPEVVTLSDGSGLVIVDDPSAKNHHENTALFHANSEELQAADTVRDVANLLVPDEAQRSGMDIVPTNQMVPASQFDYDRRADNRGSRYDDRGDVIQRQGEWFFVPVGDLESTAGGLSQCSGVPRECHGCGETRFAVTDDSTTCKACGHVHVTSADAGPDVLGSHRPTEYAPPVRADGGPEQPDDDESFAGYVRGTVRHTAEHYMARLGDVWHMAIQHGRDVVVVDTSTPEHGGGRRGMRWD